MGRIVMLIILTPLSILFAAIGIYAWRRKKPMWFWAGTEVTESEIRDIPAYNRANGIMWIIFSLVWWAATIIGICNVSIAENIIGGGCLLGFPALIIVWRKIYKKYKS